MQIMLLLSCAECHDPWILIHWNLPHTHHICPAWSGVHTSPFLNSLEGRPPNSPFFFYWENNHTMTWLCLVMHHCPQGICLQVHQLTLTICSSWPVVSQDFPNKVERAFFEHINYKGGKNKSHLFLDYLIFGSSNQPFSVFFVGSLNICWSCLLTHPLI